VTRDNSDMADAELDFKTVGQLWAAAGGKNTSGIIEWFAPPIVERWLKSEITAGDIADLRFIGAEGGGRWAEVTDGSNRVGDLQAAPASPGFTWNPDWTLIAVRNPETGARVLLDGNERASELQQAVAAGAIAADEKVQLVSGDLHMQMVLISKATSSLWR
jgi:hypothetical protein